MFKISAISSLIPQIILTCYPCCLSQVRIALDWLRGDRVEYRRFAAVLILKVRPATCSYRLFLNQITYVLKLTTLTMIV